MANSKYLDINKYTKFIVSASSYNLETEKRLLIPFTSGEKIGFINNKGLIVVEPKYSTYYGEVYDSNDVIKVAIQNTHGTSRKDGSISIYKDSLYGLLDYTGQVIFEPIYKSFIISIEGHNLLFTVQRKDYLWGVIDIDGNEIIPFGKYSWIDGFDHGYARVKNGKQPSNLASNTNKWGIINEIGEEILPVEFDNIWNFYDKSRRSTRIVKDGISKEFAIIKKPSHTVFTETNEYGNHYGEYAGSYAQDEMGYSDDVINDAFEGDPDAYWNID